MCAGRRSSRAFRPVVSLAVAVTFAGVWWAMGFPQPRRFHSPAPVPTELDGAIEPVALWPHPGWSHRLAVSPGGDLLFSVSRAQETGAIELRAWETATGRPRYRWALTGVHLDAPVFSPDGRLFAVVIDRVNESAVHVADVATGRVCRRIESIEGSISQLTFSHDARWLAIASHTNFDAAVYLCDCEKGAVGRLDSVSGPIAFAGSRLFGRCRKPTEPVADLADPRPGKAVRLYPCGDSDAESSTPDDHLVVYDPATGRFDETVGNDCVGDGRSHRVAVAQGRDVALHAEAGQPAQILPGDDCLRRYFDQLVPGKAGLKHRPLGFSPDGSVLATVLSVSVSDLGMTTMTILWDVPSGRELATLRADGRTWGFSADGNTFIVGRRGPQLASWDLERDTGRVLDLGQFVPSEIHRLAVSPNGDFVAVRGETGRGETLLVDTTTGAGRLLHHSGGVATISDVAWLPQSLTLSATITGEKGGVAVWRPDAGAWSSDRPSDPPPNVARSPTTAASS